MSLPADLNSETPHPVEPAVSYRALYPLAVASVVVGALSILTAVHWSLAIVPLVGAGLGWRAQRQIRRAPEEWTGLGLARLGIGLSIGLWIVGYGWLAFARVREVPCGYQSITYDMLQPDPNAPADPIPQSAVDLQDKRVFVKGYMQPRRQQTGIRDFVLCPSNGECPFCIPNPKRTEMIRVVLQGDLETAYTTHLIGVGGRFQADPSDPSGIPYSLEADYLR
jgi:hypothetical protein